MNIHFLGPHLRKATHDLKIVSLWVGHVLFTPSSLWELLHALPDGVMQGEPTWSFDCQQAWFPSGLCVQGQLWMARFPEQCVLRSTVDRRRHLLSLQVFS
jgi:hypothetical protein